MYSFDALTELYQPQHVLLVTPELVASEEVVRSSRSYVELLENLIGYLHEKVRGEADSLTGRRVSFLVVPWEGLRGGCSFSFAEGLSVTGSAAVLVLREVYERVVDVAVEAPRVRLVLDVAQGEPGLTLLTRRAVVHAARLAAVTSGVPVELIVYAGVERGEEVKLVELSRALITPGITVGQLVLRVLRSAGEAGVRLRLAESPGKLAALLGGLNSAARSLVLEDGLTAAVITLYSMPLAAAYFAVDSELDVSEAVELVSDAIDYLRGYTIVDREGCSVLHNVGLDYDGAYTLLAAAALARRLKSAFVASTGGDACTLEELDDRGVYLDELAEMAARIAPFNAPIASLTLSKLNEALSKCRCERDGAEPICSEKPPVPLYCGDWPGEKCVEQLRAEEALSTAGLIPSAIEATRDESGVALRYRDGCWPLLRGLLARLASKLG